MIYALIKSAIVLAAAACVAGMLRRKSASLRHAVWTAGLLGALTIPFLSVTLPGWQTGIAGRAEELLRAATGSFADYRGAAIGLWVAGAAAGMLLLLYGAMRLAWVAIRAEPVANPRWEALAEDIRRKLGIRRPVRLLQNRSVPFLGTWGMVSPRVLLPSDAENWPDDRIRMVLGHELAHIQRHDWVVQVLAEAARAIYWFNPIFWIAYARLRRESEYACDDAVVRLGVTETTYAEELLRMTRALRGRDRAHTPILAMAQPSHLELRLTALLNPSLNRLAATPWAVLVVAAVAVALTLPLAAVKPPGPATAAEPWAAPSEMPSDSAAIAPPATTGEPESTTPPVVQPADVPVAEVRSPAKPAVLLEGNAPQTDVPPAIEVPLSITRLAASLVEPVPPPAATAPLRPPQPYFGKPAVADALPFTCAVTSSMLIRKTRTLEKSALGDGPWIYNDDRTIWVADQPYVANRAVNTIWMRPAGSELTIVGRRLDGDAPVLRAGPAAPFPTGFVGIGLTFPAAGCWEVTATAGESELRFITSVDE